MDLIKNRQHYLVLYIYQIHLELIHNCADKHDKSSWIHSVLYIQSILKCVIGFAMNYPTTKVEGGFLVSTLNYLSERMILGYFLVLNLGKRRDLSSVSQSNFTSTVFPFNTSISPLTVVYCTSFPT